ncbi:unnamed protein product [Darwinula stevensoni]|uniref:Methyltransferase type 11 domain-containing protein n=1 Tax=Darwinula stevensoni TaxID=69355 RepID=A0A7R8ZZG5_9CRUS|nr:unnamed protein product [Darwinula stevensoni]CAG0882475.1 unnamed protein product [Darwinula stevensoni]
MRCVDTYEIERKPLTGGEFHRLNVEPVLNPCWTRRVQTAEMWCLVCTVGIIAAVLFTYSLFRHKLFALFMQHVTSQPDEKASGLKESFFQSLKDVVSSDPELKKAGHFRLLEVGVGTGTNFKFYPSNAKLSVIEPNSNFKDYFFKNKKKFPDIELENFFEGWGEDMKQVSSGSMDVVVCTHVMCSVPFKNTGRFLSEVKRVLAPNGRFYFFEHVGDKKGTRLRLIQNILQATLLFGFLTCGCIPNKSTEEDVKKAGFSSVDVTRFYLETDAAPTSLKGCILRIVASHINGVAVK